MTMQFKAIEFPTASEAIQWADADGRGEAIRLGGKYLVAEQSEIDRIDRAGVEFAYIRNHEMPDGTYRIMTVPVND